MVLLRLMRMFGIRRTVFGWLALFVLRRLLKRRDRRRPGYAG